MRKRLVAVAATILTLTLSAGGRAGHATEESTDWGLLSKPEFFPIAVWLQSPANASKYRDIGVNTYVGLWKGPTAPQLSQLHSAGMLVICDQNPVALEPARAKDVLGWLQPDEPDNAQPQKAGGYGPPEPPAKVLQRYQKLKSADPTRPVLLNLGQGVAWDRWYGRGVRTNHPEDYRDYVNAGDIVSFDIYPVTHDSPDVKGNLWYVGEGVSRLVNWTEGKKPVWCCIEAAGNDKVIPTARQLRSEVWIAITHGATGIIYFCHEFKPKFVEAGLLTHPELMDGVKRVDAEVNRLAPVIKSPTNGVVTAEASDPQVPIRTLCKRVAGATYVFAVTLRDKPVDVKFSLNGNADGQVEVAEEDRSLPLKVGRFIDRFDGYGVHIYKIGEGR